MEITVPVIYLFLSNMELTFKNCIFKKNCVRLLCQQYGSDWKCGMHIAVVCKHQLMFCYVYMDQRSVDAVKIISTFLLQLFCKLSICCQCLHDDYTFSLMPTDYKWNTLPFDCLPFHMTSIWFQLFVRGGTVWVEGGNVTGVDYSQPRLSLWALLIRDRVMRAR